MKIFELIHWCNIAKDYAEKDGKDGHMNAKVYDADIPEPAQGLAEAERLGATTPAESDFHPVTVMWGDDEVAAVHSYEFILSSANRQHIWDIRIVLFRVGGDAAW